MSPRARAIGAALAWLVVFGCTGGDGRHRRTLIDSRDRYDPRSLDPALATDVPTGRVVSYLFDGLTRFTPDGHVVPDLAREWEVSPDGITYTFHLRSGVTFHDGTPFSAADVKHSFERVLDPQMKGGRGWPLYSILGARDLAAGRATSLRGVAVRNDTTVVITLEGDTERATRNEGSTAPQRTAVRGFSIFPKMLAMPVAAIVPERTPPDFGDHPIGTGPWKLVEWQHDDYLLFARNASYHEGAPTMDSLEARIIPEPSTAVAEFESGTVDIVSVPDRETRTWQVNDEQKSLLRSAPSLRLIYAALNTTHGPLADVRVRQAINEAVDRRMILSRLLGGRGTLAAGVIPPSLPGFDARRQPYPYNVAHARRLLTEAGYPHGITLQLWCSQSDPFPRVAQVIQAYLARASIHVQIVQRDASSMREAARKGTTDIALKDWFADYPDAENFLYPLLHSTNTGVGGNVSFYRNTRFDSIVSAARYEQDEAKRTAMYMTADAVAFHDAPMLFLFFYKDVDAVQSWIKGFTVPVIFNGQRWMDASIIPLAASAH